MVPPDRNTAMRRYQLKSAVRVACRYEPDINRTYQELAGHYGAARCTVRNVRLVEIDPENNLLLIHGAVPGPNGGYVIVRPTNKLPMRKGKPKVRGAPAEEATAESQEADG